MINFLFKDVELSIAGYDGSTKIASLAEAFKTLKIDVTLPALKTNLLDSAALKGMRIVCFSDLL
jgi:hypothetical protein